MTPDHLKQALNIRMLRAEKAERALVAARAAEAKALAALQAIEAQLADFDASFEARVTEFYRRTSGGMTPGTLHSTSAFHTDLAQKRTGIVTMIDNTWPLVHAAQDEVAKARAIWAAAANAADNVKAMHTDAVRQEKRAAERLAEQDADEIATARAYRTAV